MPANTNEPTAAALTGAALTGADLTGAALTGADLRGVALAVDVVLFTIVEDQLNVLLVERETEPFRGSLALPGGFVLADETLEQAALRELKKETGVGTLNPVPGNPRHPRHRSRQIASHRSSAQAESKNLFLEQLETYGNPDRDPRGRVVTVAFWAVMAGLTRVQGGSDAARAELVPVAGIESREVEIAFDHERIVHDAVRRVQSKLRYSTLANRFCPPKYTISQLREVYNCLWETELDEGNFQRKVRSSPDFVVELEDTRTFGESGGRPARLFTQGNAYYLNSPISPPPSFHYAQLSEAVNEMRVSFDDESMWSTFSPELVHQAPADEDDDQD